MSLQEGRLRAPVWGRLRRQSLHSQICHLRAPEWGQPLHRPAAERQQTLRMSIPAFSDLQSKARPYCQYGKNSTQRFGTQI